MMVEDGDGAQDRRREARLRRVAAQMGLALRKSRARDKQRMDYGCYRIVQRSGGCPVAGTYPFPYSLTLDGVEEALEQLFDSPPEMGRLEDGTPRHGCAGAGDLSWGR
jgi:hypothetical protein